jgi:hypothetical protein
MVSTSWYGFTWLLTFSLQIKKWTHFLLVFTGAHGIA